MSPHSQHSGSRSVGIIGAGLIGGSIALGLRKAGWSVAGVDPDPDVMDIASERGFFDKAHHTIDSLLSASPDLVVVAAPPTATIDLVGSIQFGGPIMDVAGVKVPVLAVAEDLPGFVGTHPMAGRETSGPRAASASLFKGASWVVVEGGADAAQEVVESAIESLGARVVAMAADDHDAAVAAISHLPHLVAGALLSGATDTPAALDLAAGSFRDLTRVGASAPIPWVELLKTNRSPVLDAIGVLRDQLALFEAAIVTEDDTLLTMLSTSRETRRSLGAPVTHVRVALADEPGELAKVGHAFEESGVDIRDIQMRHAPYGGGGVLTLSVRPGEESTLRDALEAAGLLLVR
ncbi:MAG: prephenate dehydrogenase/arogenate dehydrogenase family protein [Actinomycetia bacterium]|nr:prephenate dehydrogenase/arogenate dehydrogenase family protein [Actinomycetes bacterium]